MTAQTLRRITISALALPFLALGITLAGAQAKKSAPAAPPDPSGMYTFLQDGEFVQISIDAAERQFVKPRRVTGFVSRFGDLESDKGAFLDHFFIQGQLDGDELSFTTKPVHGVAFEFKGKLRRGTAKTRAEEGYYVLRGTLKRIATAADKKTTSQSREVVLRSFPDLDGDS